MNHPNDFEKNSPDQAVENAFRNTAEVQSTKDDKEKRLWCSVCGDKAVSIHYGAVTCEGCKVIFLELQDIVSYKCHPY